MADAHPLPPLLDWTVAVFDGEQQIAQVHIAARTAAEAESAAKLRLPKATSFKAQQS